jgi:putative ATP-dependent endonuclease of OLD family
VAARLGSIAVQGLRCLHGLELGFDPLTALIGANGTGKSSTVRAVQFLFGQVELDDDDCTDGLPNGEVHVTGVLTDLPDDCAARLRPWLSDDGTLTLTRSRTRGGDGKPVVRWTCERAQAPGFAKVRAAVADGAAAEALKVVYNEARALSGDILPTWPNKPRVLETLDAHEAAHPDTVTERAQDDGLRFGKGGAHDLTTMIELLVLPAMRDAAEDSGESRGSTLARLVDITVRSGMDLDGRLAALSKETAEAYDRLLDEGAGTVLDDLSSRITGQISAFAPGTSVTLSWEPRVPALSPPQVRARIVESGHEADIGRQGHGVQRAYVFSLLRALLDARRAEGPDRPGLLLVVEEPEVYQHPLRARYVARVLADLAKDTAQSTQVVYTTHSPYFVSVDNVPAVRLLRLAATGTDGEPPRTRAAAASLDAIAARLDQAREGTGQTWTPTRVAAQLPGLLGTSVSEGLFADAVVLVEGEEDTGLIEGAAEAADADLAALGIAVISVGGKDPLPLASEVFRALAVPVYVVFDTDEKPEGQTTDAGSLRLNTMLTWLADGTAVERPPTAAGPLWAAGKPTLRAALDDEAGLDEVRAAYAATARDMGMPESTCKNGHLVRTAVAAVYADGRRSGTLDAIAAAVLALLRPVPAAPAGEAVGTA